MEETQLSGGKNLTGFLWCDLFPGMAEPIMVDRLRRKSNQALPLMDEELRRNSAAGEAMEIGRGVSAVVSAPGGSQNTIDLGGVHPELWKFESAYRGVSPPLSSGELTDHPRG